MECPGGVLNRLPPTVKESRPEVLYVLGLSPFFLPHAFPNSIQSPYHSRKVESKKEVLSK